MPKRLCLACEQERRDLSKGSNRVLSKARSTLRHHARRFADAWNCSSEIARESLVGDYGWNVFDMAHDILHASLNGCPYCRREFSSMPGGLAAVSLDVLNPEIPPFYSTNVEWCCPTCNKEKQRTPPGRWARKMLMWARHRLALSRTRYLFEDWPPRSPDA